MAKNKEILIEIGNVRIKACDSLNVQIEALEPTFIPTKKKYESRWRFKGYYPNIPSALKRIVTSELLVNKQEISDLNSHLKAVDSSNQMVLEAIDKLLDHKKCSGCQ